MNQKTAKRIKKIVMSRHPKIMELLTERYGEQKTNSMTYNQVIKNCKRLWVDVPEFRKLKIYKETEKGDNNANNTETVG